MPAETDSVHDSLSPDDLRALRLRLRRARAALSDAQLDQHSAAICEHLLRWFERWQPRCVGAYRGLRGEVDLTPLTVALAGRGTRVALPVMDDKRPGRMHFHAWGPGDALCHNGFGIAEPCPEAPRIWRREMQVVLMPLVAFDTAGNRMGMGAGYYDRYFARRRFGIRRPKLIGVAHSLQGVPALPTQPWDVPLDAVVTEQGWHALPDRARHNTHT
ncbi:MULTISPECIES: 5-formyltetrahydrofolate cyclo-ligase [unclassified Thioalkalivibrio]|uniref:5-formyltetrahydrofolate cyclo-ligase n=1 Tax=unclassified Thioalkalivibrio TaxID=2621013 RepID=UPI0003821BAB|nr:MULTISPECIES: 5-formyltetrahydrofolate cyclo-ligase [unclassified Thioalkalivibrio]